MTDPPSSVPPPSVPARRSVSSEELDRVIRRAVELQFAHGDRESGAEVDEGEVVRIGGEVGIEAEYIRRALGELRAEALLATSPDETGILHRMGGSGFVQASRVIPRGAEHLEAVLDEHLREGEALTSIRKRPGRSLWEPAGGWVAQLQRGLNMGGRTYDLAKAQSVEVVTSPLEDGFTLISLTADLRNLRGEHVGGWATGLGIGGTTAGLGVGFALAFPWLALATAPAGIWIGFGVGRRYYEKEMLRMRTVLEGLLDRLETGDGLHRKATRPNWRKQLGI